MGLFSNLPAGLQIKRWIVTLTTLVIILDLIAATSLLVVTNLMNDILLRDEPLVVYSGDIASGVYKAQMGLYQYLGEYQSDTSHVQEEIDRLRKTIEGALSLESASEFGEELGSISEMVEKYQKVIKLLPQIGAVTDWEEVEELKNKAVELGGAIEEMAGKMKANSYRRIEEKAARSGKIAAVAMYVFIGFLVLSLVIIVLLYLWWKDFQAMMLEL
jgi:hypothetical protein